MTRRNKDLINVFRVGDEVMWDRYGEHAQGTIKQIDVITAPIWAKGNGFAHVVDRDKMLCFPLLSDLQHVSGVVALSRIQQDTG